MNVQYWSKNSRDERFEYKELADLLKSSDVLVYALAINEETKNLLTDELI
jgi:phosphoglycerate dehydrogenase-like enzyme